MRHLWRDRAVFKHVKNTKGFGSLYNVSEIAEALNRKPRSVVQSLRRLETKEKVKHFDGAGDDVLWGLHAFEAPDNSN